LSSPQQQILQSSQHSDPPLSQQQILQSARKCYSI
jgi:hypothetical protein